MANIVSLVIGGGLLYRIYKKLKANNNPVQEEPNPQTDNDVDAIARALAAFSEEIEKRAEERYRKDTLIYPHLDTPEFFYQRQRSYAYVDDVCRFLKYDSAKGLYNVMINGKETPISKDKIQSAYKVTEFYIYLDGKWFRCKDGKFSPIGNSTYEETKLLAFLLEHENEYARYGYFPDIEKYGVDNYVFHSVYQLKMRNIYQIKERRERVDDLPFNIVNKFLYPEIDIWGQRRNEEIVELRNGYTWKELMQEFEAMLDDKFSNENQ